MNSFSQLRGVLSALNLIDLLPLDEDLARLLTIAEASADVRAFVQLAIDEPARFHALWDEGPDELIEELRLTRIPWSKIHRIVPQLAAAIAALETER